VTSTVTTQIRSLALAPFLITVLLIVNLRSVRLGLVSLIPNIPPVTLIFGIMGWTGISLDTVTVFAASVVLGLAVDDTR
jgi:predicted RND superfamily exporter protein